MFGSLREKLARTRNAFAGRDLFRSGKRRDEISKGWRRPPSGRRRRHGLGPDPRSLRSGTRKDAGEAELERPQGGARDVALAGTDGRPAEPRTGPSRRSSSWSAPTARQDDLGGQARGPFKGDGKKSSWPRPTRSGQPPRNNWRSGKEARRPRLQGSYGPIRPRSSSTPRIRSRPSAPTSSSSTRPAASTPTPTS